MRVSKAHPNVHSILSSCLLTVAITACGGKQESPPTTPGPALSASVAPVPAVTPNTALGAASAAPAPEAAPAASAQEHHRGRASHHPVVGMVFSELSAVGLSAEQKTAVDAIESDLKKQTATVDGPKSQLDTDVADGSATGKLDKAKIDADVKTLVQAADSTALAVQDAMNRLHKLLDVAQRKKLVEGLRAKAEKHRDAAMGAKPEEHHEHEKGAKGAKPEGHHEHGKAGHERMERLAAELGLTAEQREKLTTKLGTGLKADQANMKAHLVDAQKRMKAMFDAFVSDKFDAKKAGVGEHVGKMVEMTATGRVRFVEAVLSVLTPEQRGKFAEHLRQHAEESDEH